MTFLLNENLAPRLVAELADLYPDAVHVRAIGLASATDQEVWDRACDLSLAIVSKDSDFLQRSMVEGHPPKVIWIGLGNCATSDIGRLLRERHADVAAFQADEDGSFLVLR